MGWTFPKKITRYEFQTRGNCKHYIGLTEHYNNKENDGLIELHRFIGGGSAGELKERISNKLTVRLDDLFGNIESELDALRKDKKKTK